MRTISIACFLALWLCMASAAADISGKWSGDMPTRGGEMMPTTFTFKADGDKLTGSMTGPQGEVQLQEGKIAGDQISFSTTLNFGGNDVKIVYKGTVSGNQIKMTREREGSGQAREFTVKRAS
jgi:hypothetical protein